jgi:energy-coupling factor transporter ATP-binding protein EcfA2
LKKFTNQWVKRTSEELSKNSALVTYPSIALGTAGGFLSQPVIFGFGAFLFGAGLVHALYKGFPEKSKNPSDFLRKIVSLEDVLIMEPKPKIIGVCGCSCSGKTTFVNTVANITEPAVRTERLSARIINVAGVNYCLAFIDADGKHMPQQLSIPDKSDILILFSDHSAVGEGSIDRSRLSMHEDFFIQVKNAVGYKKIETILIVVNKSDALNINEMPELSSWADKQVDLFKSYNIANHVKYLIHSNKKSIDMSTAINEMVKNNEA